tara:strand:- start:11 stop:820 length:810 start_codon:yes stop_codon:yes gene_type:complete
MKNSMVFIFCFLISNLIFSQKKATNKKPTWFPEYAKYIVDNDTLNYRILLPENFDESKTYPLHLFLHGIGERGSDNKKQLTYINKVFSNTKNRKRFPAIVIFPQAPITDSWSSRKVVKSSDNKNYRFKKNSIPTKSLSMVIGLMDSLVKLKHVNKKRVYLTGLSNGAMGSYELLNKRPDMFAAATPICGAGHPDWIINYAKKTALWIIHGSNDRVVHPYYSLRMINAIIDAGGSPKVTLYNNVKHNSWLNIFNDNRFLPWIYRQELADN